MSNFDVGEIIDCRQIKGCEEFTIQALAMDKLAVIAPQQNLTLILVHGNAHDGLLAFDISTQELIFKCVHSNPIPFYKTFLFSNRMSENALNFELIRLF